MIDNENIQIKGVNLRYAQNIVGKRFGRLIALEIDVEKSNEYFDTHGRGKVFWKCICDCGNKISVMRQDLGSKVNSCGCLRKEQARKNGKNSANKNTYEIIGDYCKVYNTKKDNYFIIDKEFIDKIKHICWFKDNTNRWVGKEPDTRKSMYIHCYIMKLCDKNYCESDGMDIIIDHIDRNPSNNTLKNLRITTQRVNCTNRAIRSDNTSGKTGITYYKKNKKWSAKISDNNGKRIYLGLFDTFDEALNARLNAEEEYGYLGE